MGISQYDYDNMLRRMLIRSGTGAVGAAANADSKTLREAEIHQEIIDYCKSKGWLAFHGSMAHRAMRNPGEPDFCVVMDYGIVLFVEVKRDKKAKISTEQLATLAMLKKLGANACIIHSLAEFITEIARIKGIKDSI